MVDGTQWCVLHSTCCTVRIVRVIPYRADYTVRAVPCCTVSYCTRLHSSRLCSVRCAVQYVRDVSGVSAAAFSCMHCDVMH